MNEQFIVCPHCKKEIPLTEALSHQIREKLTKEVEAEAKAREKELLEKENALARREKEVEKSKKLIEEQVAEKLKLEKRKIEIEEKKKAEEALALELRDLKEQLEDKGKKLKEAQEMELALRKERRELEENKKAFELEMTRKLDQEREKIQEEVSKRITEERRLKELEKEKQINDMKKQIEELKRKAEQGSQQLQGEVLELELEQVLKSTFPMDDVQPVGVDDVKVTDGITHYEGYHAMPAGEYYVKVDGVTYYPTDYFFSADFASTSRMALHIKESIIFADGTIEIQIQDHLREPFMGTFNGFGTGSLEGVKVQGTTVGTGPGGYFLRTGTVMGWST